MSIDVTSQRVLDDSHVHASYEDASSGNKMFGIYVPIMVDNESYMLGIIGGSINPINIERLNDEEVYAVTTAIGTKAFYSCNGTQVVQSCDSCQKVGKRVCVFASCGTGSGCGDNNTHS